MKKCPRCRIVFYDDQRSRCIYCDTILLTARRDDTPAMDDESGGIGHFKAEEPIIRRFLKDRRIEGVGRMQYLIGSYFRTRTFHFMYVFCRNQFRMGERFDRALIQPLNMGSFLTLPWVVFNILDSLAARVIYSGYCPDCDWKYAKMFQSAGHDPEECAYSQEYSAIITDIMTGAIGRTEDKFREEARKKIDAGRRSAYKDLCSRRQFFSAFLDVSSIWFSVCLFLVLLVWFLFPLLSRGLPWLNR